MNRGFSKFGAIVAWPEFRVVWAILAIFVAAFVIDIILVVDMFWLFMEAALLLVATVLIVTSIYRVAETDRETKIERSELAGILESLDDAIIVYQDDFKAVFFNPAAERLFRVAAKAVVGHVFSPRDVENAGWRTMIQVIFPSLSPRVVTHSKEGEYPQIVDLSFVDPTLELRVTTALLADDRGNRIGFMKIIRNRTVLIEAVRSKSEFVTVASHQLRGPVTDVNWALQSLVQAPELSETNKAVAQTALAASQGLLRRIEDLLDIAKMEEGEFGYAFEEADAVEFIGKVLSDILPAAEKAGVKIYFDRPPAPLPHVMIDPKRLSLAMANLLENAIRYNVQNGEVIVKVDVVPGKPFVMVSIKDSGIGIPPEDLPKLFNKFYRAENAVKMQTEGSGLGLYIAKGVVNSHGGEIWADSELNRGTTITFTLPTDPSLIPKHETGGEYLL
jgi:signal transduction histidine kinase